MGPSAIASIIASDAIAADSRCELTLNNYNQASELPISSTPRQNICYWHTVQIEIGGKLYMWILFIPKKLL